MKSRYTARLFMALVFSFVITSCIKVINKQEESVNKIDPKLEKDEIDSLVNSHIALYQKGNVKGFADVYSTDAIVLGLEPDPIIGKAKITEWYESAYKNGTVGFTAAVNDVWTDGNLKACDGIWTMSDGKGPGVRGKFIWLLRRDNNKWRVFRDIFNAEPPPATKN